MCFGVNCSPPNTVVREMPAVASSDMIWGTSGNDAEYTPSGEVYVVHSPEACWPQAVPTVSEIRSARWGAARIADLRRSEDSSSTNIKYFAFVRTGRCGRG